MYIKVISLVDSLKTRFLNTASPILTNGWLLNRNLWPADLKGHEDLGDEAVQEMITVLDSTLKEANIDPTQVEEEWLKLKSYIYQRSKMSPVAKLTWKDINLAHDSKCRAFLLLVDLLLSIPASSAFSQLKLVKSDSCNHLIRLLPDYFPVAHADRVATFDHMIRQIKSSLTLNLTENLRDMRQRRKLS